MPIESFWNLTSPLQPIAKALEQLIPVEGSVAEPRKNKALEKFRVASNCYHDLYNNGLYNRAAQFARVFGIRSSDYAKRWEGRGEFREALYAETEKAMEAITIAAAAEQLLTLKPASLAISLKKG